MPPVATGPADVPPAPTADRPRRVVVDTDPGLGAPGADIDDGLAIALALASPEFRVEGLTVVNGNVDAPSGTANALALLERLGRTDVPVHVGAHDPLVRDMAPVRRLFDAVLPGAGVPAARPDSRPASDDAVGWLVDLVRGNPGEITVIAIGPMTNLARALAADPAVATDAAELVLMAGAATAYAQNVTVLGDFNAYVDPEALDAVLTSGARIRMVGLDQTARLLMTREHARELAPAGDFGRWVAECTDAWIDFLGAAFPQRPEHRYACFLHDPLTVAAVLRPELLTWAPAHVRTETTSKLTRGLVVADRGLALTPPPGPPNAAVAVDTDVPAVLELVLERLRRIAATPARTSPAIGTERTS